MISVSPLLLIPLRAGAGENSAWVGAFLIASVIILPDVYRLCSLLITAFFSGTVVSSKKARAQLKAGFVGLGEFIWAIGKGFGKGLLILVALGQTLIQKLKS